MFLIVNDSVFIVHDFTVCVENVQCLTLTYVKNVNNLKEYTYIIKRYLTIEIVDKKGLNVF